MAKKEPEIEIIGTGSIPAGEMPEDAKVIGMPSQEQPKKRTVQDILTEDVNFLRGLHFNLDEVEKFGLIIAKVKQDMVNIIIDLEKEAQHGKADA